MKHFKPCSYLPFKRAESYFCHTERWDQEELRNCFPRFFYFYYYYLSWIAALSQNLPNSFSQATSVISAEPTQHPQTILLIVLPQMPLFWIIIHGSHSLCMASRQMAHLSRIPWVRYSAVSSLFSTGETEASLWMADWIAGLNFFFFFLLTVTNALQTLHVWACNQKNKNTIQPPVASYHQFLCSAAGPTKSNYHQMKIN